MRTILASAAAVMVGALSAAALVIVGTERATAEPAPVSTMTLQATCVRDAQDRSQEAFDTSAEAWEAALHSTLPATKQRSWVARSLSQRDRSYWQGIDQAKAACIKAVWS